MHVVTAQVSLVHRDRCVEKTPHDRPDDQLIIIIIMKIVHTVHI